MGNRAKSFSSSGRGGRGRMGRGTERVGVRPTISLNPGTSYSNKDWKEMSDADNDKVVMISNRSSEAKAHKAAATTLSSTVVDKENPPKM